MTPGTTSASLLALALGHAGMVACSLAMERHFGQISRGRGLAAAPAAALRGLLRVAAAALLAVALWVCVGAWGGPVGTVLWLGFLSAAAMLVVLGLTYAPRLAAGLSLLALVVAGAALLVLSWA